ncbi:MAG: alpha/beta fold hydrolase [Pseudomonadota bacterium]
MTSKIGRLLFISGLFLSFCTMGCGPPGTSQSYGTAGVTEKIITLPNTHQIRTLMSAERQNPKAFVIFIHGTPGSADTWLDTMAKTPANITSVAYDRLGFGSSRPKGAVTSLKEHAETVALLKRAVVQGQNTPTILVGHSYGGPIAAKVAVQYPEEITAIILVAAALDPSLEKIHWAQRLATYQPIKFLIGSTLRNANAELITLEQELVDLQTQINDTAVATYVLHGSEDELVPAENVAFMKRQYQPSALCSIEMIEGQNHFLPWNEIDRLWALIERSINTPAAAC